MPPQPPGDAGPDAVNNQQDQQSPSPRRGRILAWGIGVLALVALAVLLVQMMGRPVADDYTGHAASPTPTPTTADTSPSAVPSPATSTDSDAASPSAPTSGDTTTDNSDVGGTDTPTGNTSTDPAGTAYSPTPSSGSGVSSSQAASATASAVAVTNAPPTWNPATTAPPGAAVEPKVPDGEGASPYRLPEVPERMPAVSTVPPAAAATGELAAGFPADVIPVPAGVTIQSTSVASQGNRLFVSLVALSERSASSLLDDYARQCQHLGWAITRGPDADGVERLDCGFGADSLSVSAPTLPTGRVELTATGAFTVTG